MNAETLIKMDRIAAKAGSRKPDDVMEAMGCIFQNPGCSVDGFVTRVKTFIYYGVNPYLPGIKYDFGTMHEAFHVLCKHLDIPGFLKAGIGSHIDLPGSFADYRMIATTERDANIGAADFIIKTKTILEMLGYHNADVEEYRAKAEAFEQAMREYKRLSSFLCSPGDSRWNRMQDLQESLSILYSELEEQAQDIETCGICLPKSAIAQNFSVPEYIIDYKLEALRIRDYSISTVELPAFDHVFSRWN